MLNLSCHCGAVRVELPAPPAFINACNCSLCRKIGAQWAYFAPDQVRPSGTTSGYVRADKPGAGAEVHFCPTCGATTHFTLTPETVARHGNTVCGVNMALADEADLAGIELRFPDGRAWSGEGPFDHVRPASIIGAD